MVGAQPKAWDAALPVLNEIGATVHHMGPVGAGAVAKLCGNHLVSAILASLAESLAMAKKSGLDCHELIKLWGESDFRSPIAETSVPIGLPNLSSWPGDASRRLSPNSPKRTTAF